MKVLNFMKGSTYMLLSLFVLLSAACTSSSDYTLGRWHQRSDFDGKTRSGAACFTIGDIGYIIGGTNGKAQRLKSMYSYNIEGDYFTELFSEDATATMPSARNYATGFAVGGKGYVSCGWDGTNYVGDTWEYNPSTNTWKQMDDFLGGARYGALAFTIGNDAYMGCGYDENYLKDFYKFNPNAAAGSQWTKVNGYSGSKRRFGMYFEINNVVYLVGGENNGDDCKDFWKFDGTTWTKLRYITSDDDLVTEGTDDSYNDDYTSIVRNSGVAFSLNGKGYIALGRTAAGTYRKNYWIYDPSTDLWSNNDGDVTDFEGSQRINPVCITNGKRAFVSTGQNGSSLYYDDTWEFSPNEYKEK
jgi:N-acetylneuraminic acid mutarotase